MTTCKPQITLRDGLYDSQPQLDRQTDQRWDLCATGCNRRERLAVPQKGPCDLHGPLNIIKRYRDCQIRYIACALLERSSLWVSIHRIFYKIHDQLLLPTFCPLTPLRLFHDPFPVPFPQDPGSPDHPKPLSPSQCQGEIHHSTLLCCVHVPLCRHRPG